MVKEEFPEEDHRRRYRLRDVTLRKRMLPHLAEALIKVRDEMNQYGGWGSAVRTEKDKTKTAARVLHAGLHGAFIDTKWIPSIEEILDLYYQDNE